MTNFGEYVFFFGLSRAVHVPFGGHHGIKRNHIYYSPTTEEELPDDKMYSVRTGDGDQVYCREAQGRTVYYLMHCYNNHTWRERGFTLRTSSSGTPWPLRHLANKLMCNSLSAFVKSYYTLYDISTFLDSRKA